MPMKVYRLNLIRDRREKERRAEQRRRYTLIGVLTSFALLLLALVYTGLTAWNMELVLSAEERKLNHLKAEYQKYTAARMVIEKSDVELLNSLHGRGILWTKKLAALANHLPDGYTITGISFRDGELKVSGFGKASTRQDQLLVIDGYLNSLRGDTTFTNVFKKLYLNNTDRVLEEGDIKVLFEFSALTSKARRPQ